MARLFQDQKWPKALSLLAAFTEEMIRYHGRSARSSTVTCRACNFGFHFSSDASFTLSFAPGAINTHGTSNASPIAASTFSWTALARSLANVASSIENTYYVIFCKSHCLPINRSIPTLEFDVDFRSINFGGEDLIGADKLLHCAGLQSNSSFPCVIAAFLTL